MQYSLILNGLCKRFGQILAVDSISASIPKGSIYGFLGPNGAGKTTTIRMIMSILYPDSGSIQLLGSDNPATQKGRQDRHIFYPCNGTGRADLRLHPAHQ